MKMMINFYLPNLLFELQIEFSFMKIFDIVKMSFEIKEKFHIHDGDIDHWLHFLNKFIFSTGDGDI